MVVDSAIDLEFPGIIDRSFYPQYAVFVVHFDTYHQLVVTCIIT